LRPRRRRSSLALAALAVVLAAPGFAASTYSVDPSHSDVSFQVRHFVSKVRGQFNDFAGIIVHDEADPARSSVEFVVQVASIDTANDKRDNHLRSADFFDVAHHPTIVFKSSKVEPVSATELRVTGPLTMRGVTREVTLPVTFAGTVKDPWGGTRAGYTTTIQLDRQDYGIKWNKTLDSGGLMLSDEIDVTISLEAVTK
jgi:polyisoprenoid-binding protein YceI